MAGEIHDDRGVRPCGLHLVEEVAHDDAQVVRSEIAALHDLEPRARERLGHEARVVHGGRESPTLIGSLTDYEGDALLGSGLHPRSEEAGDDDHKKGCDPFEDETRLKPLACVHDVPAHLIFMRMNAS